MLTYQNLNCTRILIAEVSKELAGWKLFVTLRGLAFAFISLLYAFMIHFCILHIRPDLVEAPCPKFPLTSTEHAHVFFVY